MIKTNSIIFCWSPMIKLFSLSLLFVTAVFSQENKTPISQFEIKEGKKIYYPIENRVISKTVPTELIKYSIKLPVFKAFHVEYMKK